MDIKNNIKNIYSNKLKSIFKTCNNNKEFSRMKCVSFILRKIYVNAEEEKYYIQYKMY